METGDAFGQLLLDHLEGRAVSEIVERDDGFVVAAGPPEAYFAPHRAWPSSERRALRSVRGRVLDVGCGAGRAALHLEPRGYEVVSIDSSPLAVEVARRRGARDARVVALEDVDASVGAFDTVLLLGNNVGLLGGERRGARLLRGLARLTGPRARILAESNDWSRTDDPAHLAYHERNRRRGRLPGQNRLRVRHRDVATPWFDYLLTTPAELAALAQAGGWRIARRFDDPTTSMYVAVLEKA